MPTPKPQNPKTPKPQIPSYLINYNNIIAKKYKSKDKVIKLRNTSFLILPMMPLSSKLLCLIKLRIININPIIAKLPVTSVVTNFTVLNTRNWVKVIMPYILIAISSTYWRFVESWMPLTTIVKAIVNARVWQVRGMSCFSLVKASRLSFLLTAWYWRVRANLAELSVFQLPLWIGLMSLWRLLSSILVWRFTQNMNVGQLSGFNWMRSLLFLKHNSCPYFIIFNQEMSPSLICVNLRCPSR